MILEIYSSYLTNENLPQESNITRLKMEGRWLRQSERQLAVDLSLDKYIHQIDSIPSELISLIGLIDN